MKLLPNNDGFFVEVGSHHVTTRDVNGHVTLRELPPAEPTLEQRIYTVIAQSGRAVTRREIAKALGLTSSGWLNAKIDYLVSEGYLVRTYQPYRSNMLVYFYELA